MTLSRIFVFIIFIAYYYVILITLIQPYIGLSVEKKQSGEWIIDRICYDSILAIFPTTFIILLLSLRNIQLSAIQWIKNSIVIYLGIMLFLFVKELLDDRFFSKLFTEKDNFQESLDRFSHDISKIMTISDLGNTLITEVANVLGTKSISILELEEGREEFSLNITRGNHNYPQEQIINWFKHESRMISTGEIGVLDNGVIVKISESNNKKYLMWIGEKKRTQFNQDEKLWLKTISRYVSIVYENLQLIAGLREELEDALNKQNATPSWLLRLLFSLSEKERQRLAFDLHDTVLQDQLLWYRKLDEIASNNRIPLDLRNELTLVTEGMLDVIYQIRELCNELRPPFLNEIGIVEALGNLVDDVQLRSNCLIKFTANDFKAECNYDQALAIYRIAQELLTNTAKHSKANRVEITLGSSDNYVFLSYQDDGVGMSFENYQPSSYHMGLTGIKQRVASLEGETRFHSAPGKGFRVFIRIPLTIPMDRT